MSGHCGDEADDVSTPVLSSELLGFPAQARVLIINADDFGMYPGLNTAVIESIEHGVASSCSLMQPCPGAQQGLQLLAARPHIPFGIHLTLLSDSQSQRWAPMAARTRVASLLDRDGRFFTSAAKTRLLQRAKLDEVEIELDAQIDTVIATGAGTDSPGLARPRRRRTRRHLSAPATPGCPAATVHA